MPKIVDHELYKEEILKKSFQVFANQGYSNLSTRQLAKELGCTTGTLYHYFESKEEIFSQMIQSLLEKDITTGVQAVSDGKNFIQRYKLLSQFVDDNFTYFSQLLFIIFDCFRQGSDFKKEKQVIRKSIASYRDTITKELALPININFVGTIVLGLLIGLIIQKIVDPKKINLNKINNSMINSLEALS